MAKARVGVPVTRRALFQRINRALAERDEVLKKLRGDRWWPDLGDYYVVNIRVNGVVAKHVDLADFGRELGVLAPYEKLAEDA